MPPEPLDRSDLFKYHIATSPVLLDQSDLFKDTYKRQTDRLSLLIYSYGLKRNRQIHVEVS